MGTLTGNVGEFGGGVLGPAASEDPPEAALEPRALGVVVHVCSPGGRRSAVKRSAAVTSSPLPTNIPQNGKNFTQTLVNDDVDDLNSMRSIVFNSSEGVSSTANLFLGALMGFGSLRHPRRSGICLRPQGHAAEAEQGV